MEPFVVEIRKPLGERAMLAAEAEDMELKDFVDFVLRDYMEDWEAGQEEDEDEEDQAEEDEEEE